MLFAGLLLVGGAARAREPRSSGVRDPRAAVQGLASPCRELVAAELERGTIAAGGRCEAERRLAQDQQLRAARSLVGFGLVERATVSLAEVSLLLSEGRGCKRWPLRLPQRATLGLFEAKAAGCWIRRYSGSLAVTGVLADGSRVAVAAGGWVTLWAAAGGNELARVSASGPVALSPDGSRLAAAVMGGEVRLWSADGTERAVLRHTGTVTGLAFAPDDVTRRFRVSLRDDGATQLTCEITGEPVAEVSQVTGSMIARDVSNMERAHKELAEIPVRDILAMGARPIGAMDPLRFGPLDAPDTARVLPGIVAGVGGYGNCLGLPNIGGEVVFDPTYYGNPLVNALCVGVLKHDDLHLAFARGTGNKVILYGAATGGDGIGGASILASETFDADGPAKRPSVQVGDPFMEKLLIECTLELFAENLISGIQDLGAAGLSCATSELASAGDGGMHVNLNTVPLRDHTLAPEEILMSESQERMMAVVEPHHVERFLEICAKWDVLATVVGEVTDGDRLIIEWNGEVVVDVAECLHGGIGRSGADEAETEALQVLRQRDRLSRRGGHLGERVGPHVTCRRTVRLEHVGQLLALRVQGEQCPGVGDGGVDLHAVAHDAGIGHQPLNVRLVEVGHDSGVEPGEGGAKGGSLAQNRDPRQAGLERLEAEPLEQFALIGRGLRRHPPFGVVVGLVQLVARAEAAKGAHWEALKPSAMACTICACSSSRQVLPVGAWFARIARQVRTVSSSIDLASGPLPASAASARWNSPDSRTALRRSPVSWAWRSSRTIRLMPAMIDSNWLGVIDCAPSVIACSGSQWTSRINPSAPHATDALLMLSTR